MNITSKPMQRPLEEILSELYLSNIDMIGEGVPSWVNAMRSGALENFNLLSLPSSGNEDYQHTDIRRMFAGEWETYFVPSGEIRAEDRVVPANGYVVDVVNGFCLSDELTTLDNGIVYGSLRAAMSTIGDVVSKYYNKIADNERAAVTALNTVFAQDGAFVYVPNGVKAELPFTLTFVGRSDEQAQMCFSRALIVVEDGAEADVVIAHVGGGDRGLLADHVREVYTGTDATLKITEVKSTGGEVFSVNGNYLRQECGSRVDMVNLWLGGGVTRVNAVTDLAGADCESNLHGLYFANGTERVDVNMTVNHLVPDCRSSELVKGVVSGEAVGAFTGKVYVAPDAQRTEAFQQSRNIQLSETAKVYTEPQLEIYADDVKCSHGATVGQMDEEAVYYMRQRGLSEADAKRLQLFGFVNDVISKCSGDAACECLAGLAQARIDEM